jgi:pentatricopeptide repeat protein
MKIAADRPAKTRMVAVMDAAIAADNLDYAYLAVQEINKRGFQQDPVTLKRLVSATVNAGQVDRAYQLVDSFINFGVLADGEALSFLIEGYVKAGNPAKAYEVFLGFERVEDHKTVDVNLIKSLHDSLKNAGLTAEAAKVSARL